MFRRWPLWSASSEVSAGCLLRTVGQQRYHQEMIDRGTENGVFLPHPFRFHSTSIMANSAHPLWQWLNPQFPGSLDSSYASCSSLWPLSLGVVMVSFFSPWVQHFSKFQTFPFVPKLPYSCKLSFYQSLLIWTIWNEFCFLQGPQLIHQYSRRPNMCMEFLKKDMNLSSLSW